ncbi:MAG TPA: DUF1801 domain-containing protein [Candidatus Dormibacteraeota bacterium]
MTKRKVLTHEEREILQEVVKDRKGGEDGESAVLAKLAEMTPEDRALGERLHALIKSIAPSLTPRTWYGMPAYTKDGKVVCFYQAAQKYKVRYSTLGFQEAAHLDEGPLWPVAFALRELTPAAEAQITALLKKAVS